MANVNMNKSKKKVSKVKDDISFNLPYNGPKVNVFQVDYDAVAIEQFLDRWNRRDRATIDNHEQLLRHMTFGPFVFGSGNDFHEGKTSVKWIRLMEKENFVPRTALINTIPRTDIYMYKCMGSAIQSLYKLFISEVPLLSKVYSKVNEVNEKNTFVSVDTSPEVEVKKVIDDCGIRTVCNGFSYEKANHFVMFYVQLLVHQMHLLKDHGEDVAYNWMDNLKKLDEKSSPHHKDGNQYFKQEEYEKAISHYSDALKKNPYSHICFGNRALCLMKLKKFEPALTDSLRCLILKPGWPKGWYRYVDALDSLGETEMAVAVIDEALGRLKGDDVQHLKKQKQSFIQKLKMPKDSVKTDKNHNVKNKVKAKSGDDEDDPPPLVSDSDDTTDSSDDDSPKKRLPPRPRRKKTDLKPTNTIPVKPSASSNSKTSETKKDSSNISDNKKTLDSKIEEKLKSWNNKAEEKPIEKVKVEPPKTKVMSEVERKKLKEKELKDTFHSALLSATEAILDQRARFAMTHYHKALDMIHEHSFQKLGQVKMDYLIVKFAYSISCIETKDSRSILIGIKEMEGVILQFSDVTFPLAYYAIGKGYRFFNRFSDALAPLEKGMKIIERRDTGVYVWPATQKVIDITRPGNLKTAIQELITYCKYPPDPDAVCRFAECKGHFKKEIYFTDPDFEGFIETKCRFKCVLSYHISCWKKIKGIMKLSDKEIMGHKCLTPDCQAVIAAIKSFGSNGLIERHDVLDEAPAERQRDTSKKKIKMVPSSEKTIKKREERKNNRRLKKALSKEEKARENGPSIHLEQQLSDTASKNNSDDIFSNTEESRSIPGPIDEDIYDENMVVIHTAIENERLEAQPDVPKPGKKKKKRKNEKVKMSLDEFIGPTPANDSPPIVEIVSPLAQQSKEPGHDPDLTAEENQEALKIYKVFQTFLSSHGPIATDSDILDIVTEGLEFSQRCLINQKKGIVNFLLQNLQFCVNENHLSLTSQAALVKKRVSESRKPEVKNTQNPVNLTIVNKNNKHESIIKTPLIADIPIISKTPMLGDKIEKKDTKINESSIKFEKHKPAVIEISIKSPKKQKPKEEPVKAVEKSKKKESRESVMKLEKPVLKLNPEAAEFTSKHRVSHRVEKLKDEKVEEEISEIETIDLSDDESDEDYDIDDIQEEKTSQKQDWGGIDDFEANDDIKDVSIGSNTSFKSAEEVLATILPAKDYINPNQWQTVRKSPRRKTEKEEHVPVTKPIEGIKRKDVLMNGSGDNNGQVDLPTSFATPTRPSSSSSASSPIICKEKKATWSGLDDFGDIDVNTNASVVTSISNEAPKPCPLPPGITRTVSPIGEPRIDLISAASLLNKPTQALNSIPGITPIPMPPSAMKPIGSERKTTPEKERVVTSQPIQQFFPSASSPWGSSLYSFPSPVRTVEVPQISFPEAKLRCESVSVAVQCCPAAEFGETQTELTGADIAEMEKLPEVQARLDHLQNRFDIITERDFQQRHQITELEDGNKAMKKEVNRWAQKLQKSEDEYTELEIKLRNEIKEKENALKEVAKRHSAEMKEMKHRHDLSKAETSSQMEQILNTLETERKRSAQLEKAVVDVKLEFTQSFMRQGVHNIGLMVQRIQRTQEKSELLPSAWVKFFEELKVAQQQLCNAAPIQSDSKSKKVLQQIVPPNVPKCPSQGLLPTPNHPATGAANGPNNTLPPGYRRAMPPGHRRSPAHQQMGAGTMNPPPLRRPPNNSFSKVVELTQAINPNVSREQVQMYITRVRQQNNGSLSNIPIDQIIEEITRLIQVDRSKTSRLDDIPAPAPATPPPGFSGPTVYMESASASSKPAETYADLDDDDEEVCPICHELMIETENRILDCRHVFHDHCIRLWFQTQTTCPNCRRHCLLPDEFPSLGH